jgi:hypothetical protein
MTDQFTKVTRENYFQRLGSSFVGMIIGIVLLFVAGGLLIWNDGRAVDAQRGLNAGARAVISLTSTQPAPANEGKLVHMTGQAVATAPLADADTGASFPNTLMFVRKVEMYQWVQETTSASKDKVGGTQETTTTYTYSKKWSELPQDSSTFAKPEGHANPAMPFVSSRVQASDAKIGGFALPTALLDQLSPETPVVPAAVPAGWRTSGTSLYKGTGSDEAPVLGDVRVTYMPVASATVLSVLGKQTGATLEPWVSNNSNYGVLIAQQGMVSPSLMIKEQKAAESILTWVLRALGTGLNILAFTLLMGPLRALGNVIPLVASIIGGGIGMIAFGLGAGLSLIQIAIAWFAFRPLLSAALIVAGLAVIYFFRSRKGAGAVAPASA